MLNAVEFAPVATARHIAAAIVHPGCAASARTAYRMSRRKESIGAARYLSQAYPGAVVSRVSSIGMPIVK